jgi:formylglycine-generating enzyme required for sulfatase activity
MRPVGLLTPNPWGLFDMHGNVWEWCLDIWAGSYPGGTVSNYAGPGEGWLRVARGGSWLYAESFSRSANRDDYGPENRCSDIGFRVVLAPGLPPTHP